MSETALLLETRAEIKNAQFSTIRELLLAQAKEHQLSVKENSDNKLVTQTPFGEFAFYTAGSGVRICIKSNSEDKLFMIKEGLIDHITHFMPDAANDLRWSDALEVGSLPPNFHFTEIQQLEPVGPCFTRITVKLDNLETFNNDAIHFRLVLPPAGLKDVAWPTVTENGSTAWPKGDKALHRPVYTTRYVDHEKGLMQFDIFHHDGGRATQWSRSAKVGDRLAIIGPGGGGIPTASRINLYGDETAFPAIARILENLASDTVGNVVLQSDLGTQTDYPFTAPAQMTITYIKSDAQFDLADIALDEMDFIKNSFLWFAGEKAMVKRVREAVKQQQGETEQVFQHYIAAYWSATH